MTNRMPNQVTTGQPVLTTCLQGYGNIELRLTWVPHIIAVNIPNNKASNSKNIMKTVVAAGLR